MKTVYNRPKGWWTSWTPPSRTSPWNHPTTVEDMAVTGLCLAHANCVVGVFETQCPNAWISSPN